MVLDPDPLPPARAKVKVVHPLWASDGNPRRKVYQIAALTTEQLTNFFLTTRILDATRLSAAQVSAYTSMLNGADGCGPEATSGPKRAA